MAVDLNLSIINKENLNRIGSCLLQLMTFSDSPVVMFFFVSRVDQMKTISVCTKDIYIPTKVVICYIVTLDTMAVQLQLSIIHEES